MNHKLELSMIIDGSLAPCWVKNLLLQRIKNCKFSELRSKKHYIKKVLCDQKITRALGIKGFWKNDFINRNVLDPRWDSECIVEAAIELIKEYPIKDIIELGVGSGALILSILKDRPKSTLTGTGVDIDVMALKTCIRNSNRLNIKNIDFYQSSWWEFNKNLNLKYDLVICNPPYLNFSQSLSTQNNTGDPWIALYGGEDGLDDYHIILQNSITYTNYFLILEICYIKINSILDLISMYGWKLKSKIQDLNGNIRALICEKRK